jgi:quercetin dioxygenase-like cupin family protein
MAVRIRRDENVPWEENRLSGSGTSATWGVRTKPYFDPAETGMMLRLVEYAPGYMVEAHSHAAPEAMYITRGEMRIGDHTYGPGDALYIDPETVYGPLTAGSQGVQFLLAFAGTPGMKSAE